VTNVACPSCGVRNPLGHVFCMKCGGRLVTKDGAPVPQGRGLAWLQALGRALRVLLRIAVLAALVAAVGLAFGPVARPPETSGEKGVHGVVRALTVLQRAERAGTPAAAAFLEADVNAYVHAIVAHAAAEVPEDARYGTRMEDAWFRMPAEGRLELHLQGRVLLWKFERPVSLGIRAAAEPESRGMSFRVTGLSLGRLPLPPFCIRLFDGWLAGLRTLFGKELEVLQGADEARFGAGQADFTVRDVRPGGAR